MYFYPTSSKEKKYLTFWEFKIFEIKKRKICGRNMPGNIPCQISGWYIYFWQTYSPKTVSVYDVIFSNCDLEHFLTSHRNKNDIFAILNSNWLKNTKNTFVFFVCKYQFENLTLRDPEFTWPFSVVILDGVRLQNGFFFSIILRRWPWELFRGAWGTTWPQNHGHAESGFITFFF